MDRVATGIKGFDNLIEGGLPRGSNTLVTGVPGSGKTIFGLEYLYRGAQMGENGVYISLDSSLELLREQGKRFGWDLEGLEMSGKLSLFKVPLDKVKFNMFETIKSIKEKTDAKRLVFDNLATFSLNLDLFPLPVRYTANIVTSGLMGTDNAREAYTRNTEKSMSYLAISELADIGTTNVIITYGDRSGSTITVDGVSEFVCDGIVELYNELIGTKHIRTMSILKMRDTDHSQYIHAFELGKDGIEIKPPEQL
jgi:circadian clock protein KaiC